MIPIDANPLGRWVRDPLTGVVGVVVSITHHYRGPMTLRVETIGTNGDLASFDMIAERLELAEAPPQTLEQIDIASFPIDPPI